MLTNLFNGIGLGSVYAIIALGYTMVYGIAKMLNFAHGDVIMVGGYASYCTMMYLGWPPAAALLFSMAICTVLGVLVERLAYKPLRNASNLAVLITAIGVSYFLQNAALLIWSSNPKVFPNIFNMPFFQSVTASAASVSADAAAADTASSGVFSVKQRGTLITIVVNLIIMAGLTLFTSKTKMGKAMRAVSEDRGAATLMGINVNRTISMTLAIGSGLAAIAGVLLCATYPNLVPTTGSMPGIKAFVAAVFGGIGSIPGAMIGGILLGVIEITARALVPTVPSDIFVFAVLIIVLLVKPSGLFGKTVREKV